MKMKNIIIKPFKGLPCELETFLINEMPAFIDDFGNGDDEREGMDLSNIMPDTIQYGCCNRKWRRDLDRKELAMNKYHLTEDEWESICSSLEDKLSIGVCGWCV